MIEPVIDPGVAQAIASGQPVVKRLVEHFGTAAQPHLEGAGANQLRRVVQAALNELLELGCVRAPQQSDDLSPQNGIVHFGRARYDR